MSVIDEAVITKLESVSGITDLISTRIYNVKFPQNPTWPALRVNKISSTRGYSMDGVSGYVTDRFQIDAVAKHLLDASALSEAVRAGIEAFKGTVDGIKVHGVFLENESNGWDDEVRVFRIQQDYLIHHN